MTDNVILSLEGKNLLNINCASMINEMVSVIYMFETQDYFVDFWCGDLITKKFNPFNTTN